ncbi:MAG: Maf family protein [Anaerolineae bacterium]
MKTPLDAMQPQLILASSSPRRRELLTVLGLPFQVITPGAPFAVDETPLPGELPSDLVQRLSRLKAEAVAENLKRSASSLLAHSTQDNPIFIIAADTEVALGTQILGKPGHSIAATEMLQALRRQAHQVYSGLTVARLTEAELTFVTRLHQSTVWMRPYSDAEIAAYVASGDPLDKAGAYGIQNKSFAPVARWQGCFASIMGLPLGELASALRELGLQLPPIAPLCSRYTGHPCCQE